MTRVYKALCLVLLLVAAQQGAVVHELSHAVGVGTTELKAAPGESGAPCALCPAFAQVVTPAFSHSFQLPLLVRAAPELSAEPLYLAADDAVPAPRSRGPPV